MFKDLDIVADIKQERLKGIGHALRMYKRTVQKTLESKPEGSKRGGTPRLRWMEDVEKDLREMEVKRWRQKTVCSEEWAPIIKEAKALRGPLRVL